MFLYVCKQTFRISKVCISQKVKGVIMRNLRGTIFFMWRRMYCKIFISALKSTYTFKHSNLLTYLNLQINLLMNTFVLISHFKQVLYIHVMLCNFSFLVFGFTMYQQLLSFLDNLQLFSVEKTKLYVYKLNVSIDGKRQIFSKFII